MTDDEIRIVRAVGEMRQQRVSRLTSWCFALAVALAASVASHTCDLVKHRAEMRSCLERAP